MVQMEELELVEEVVITGGAVLVGTGTVEFVDTVVVTLDDT